MLIPCCNNITSVYFQNGSSFDIAKIEGSPAYKQLMRIAVPSDDTNWGSRTMRHTMAIPHRTFKQLWFRSFITTYYTGLEAMTNAINLSQEC
jgi:hypothetical protein